MKICEKFRKGRAVLSFEVFPPKKNMPYEKMYSTLQALAELKPDYISVTYGAGGSNPGITCEIAAKIIKEYKIDALAHLTCINSTHEEIDRVLAQFSENGIENILALRGDIVEGVEPKNEFCHASELAEYIGCKAEHMSISGACYPEVHIDAENEVEDILNLKKKVDAGVNHLISQLFFDNEAFYRFRERAAIAGISVPICAGIMPVTNTRQIERMVSMCGASLPPKFVRVMQKYGDKPEALMDAGIAYAIEQIVDLLAAGVDGIHIYTMNNPFVASKIHQAVVNLL